MTSCFRGGSLAAVLISLLVSEAPAPATDYLFNPTSGTNAWSTTTIWTPNGTPSTGDNIDATGIGASGATLALNGTTRTINNLTKTSANRWNISGNSTTVLSTLNINNLTIGTSNMVFFDGAAGGLQLNLGNVTVTAGTLFFGATSLSTSNLQRGVAVSGITTVSGGSLNINVSNGSGNSYSLGLLTPSSTGAVNINNAPTGKGNAVTNVVGLNGAGGSVQVASSAGQNGNAATLAITNTTDYSSATLLRDGSNTSLGLTFSLSKAGSGTQTLTGVNTFTGATTITNGVLKLGNTSALGGRSGIVATNTDTGTNVSATGTLDLGGQTGVTEVIRLNGTGFGGNGALINTGAAASIGSGIAAITQTAGGTTAPTLTISGGGGSGATATLSMGVTTATFTINGGTTTYSVAPTVTISSGGGTTVATATAILNGSGVVTGISINTIGAGYTSAPNVAFSGGTVITGGTNPTGTGNANNFTTVGYNITATGTGYTSAPTIGFSSGTFAATATVSGIVLAGNSSIGGTGDITVNGVVSESGGSRVLTKVGANTLTLTNTGNSYSGGTIINGGSVAITSDSALGAVPGAPTPGQITLNTGTLATTGSFTLNANRGIALEGAGGQITIVSGTLGYSGSIAGAGGLTKAGAGTLTLSGANTYSGPTGIAAGTVQFTTPTALYNGVTGSWTDTNLIVESGATAAFNVGGVNEFTSANVDTLSALGTASGGFKSGAILALDTTNATGGVFTHGGNIVNANSLNLTKLGAGTLALSGNSTYTGATTVTAGTLEVSSNNALGSSTGGTTVASGATLSLTGGVTVTGETLSIAGDGAESGLGALRNVGGNNTWTGNIAAAAVPRINSDAGNLLISGDVVTSGSGNFTVGGAGDIEISGVLSGPLTLFKASAGAGTLTLSNPANSYTGITTIGNGTIRISAEGNLGATPGAFVSNNLRLRGGSLETTADMSLSANRGVLLSNGGGGFNTDAGTTLTVNGVISGAATDTLAKSGEGTLILAASSNTYTGPTTVTAGTMQLSGGINATSQINVSGGTLLLGASDVINNAAPITLGGGTLATGGFSEGTPATVGLGLLILSGDSTIDLGSGNGSQLLFAGLGTHQALTILSIVNWSGTSGASGGVGDDRLMFAGLASDFTGLYAPNEVSFNGTPGYTAIQFDETHYEIVAVPEPSTTGCLGAGVLLALIGFRERRRLWRGRR